jgi:hypothetical protein
LRTGARGFGAAPGGYAVERVATMAEAQRMCIGLPAIVRPFPCPLPPVTNEFRRLGLIKASRLQPGPPVVSYEHIRPGELINLDIKKLGRIEVGWATALPGTASNSSVSPAGSNCIYAWTSIAACPTPNY